MLSSLIIAAGAPYKRGFAYGKAAARLIEENLLLFRSGLEASGSSPAEATALAEPATWSNLEALEEMAGIAAGAGVPFPELLAFNKYHTLVLPEECTVMMAVGKASGSGATIFMKNSDKVGDESLTGKNFYKYKEINIVLFIELENGTKIAGVAAAGSMGLKMGLNNKGIAAGANISRTKELAEKRVNITQIRALDRTQLLREGLEKDSLGEAVRLVAGKILDNPMATPGNLEFANAREAFIIEGSYDRVAVKKVVDDIDSRSNCFVVLRELNDPRDVSSYCRYVRTQELLKAKKGRLTAADMLEFSMDHANGPGPNSICRHSTDFHEETSLSAAIMEIDPERPEKSRISICLGKPCRAWRDKDGHVAFDMETGPAAIPPGFLNGETFRRFYLEG